MHETESARLDQFRTFQQTIRGSDKYLVVGIDKPALFQKSRAYRMRADFGDSPSYR